MPAIAIPVPEPTATDHLHQTDACDGVDCNLVGTREAPTLTISGTLSGKAKTDDCNITPCPAGTTFDVSATDHGSVKVNPPLTSWRDPADLPVTFSTATDRW